MGQKNIVIIGAPRSGTNMLRDVLTKLPGVGTWPCDEINYIWRHGNVRFDSDQFTTEMARPEVISYIRQQFENLATKQSLEYIIEKTCANSLRVNFVDRVFPDAKFIYIVRDGRDVVASAMKRWRAGIDLKYIMAKARYVPLSDIPYYGSRYLINRIYRIISKEKRLSTWGPRLEDMPEILAKHNLAEVCAIQWRECVNRSDKSFSTISKDRVYMLKYESFVIDPEGELENICAFLAVPLLEKERKEIIRGVSNSSIGKGRVELGDQLYNVLPLMEQTLKYHGYV